LGFSGIASSLLGRLAVSGSGRSPHDRSPTVVLTGLTANQGPPRAVRKPRALGAAAISRRVQPSERCYRKGDTNASKAHTTKAIAQAALTSPSFAEPSASIVKSVVALWSEPRARPRCWPRMRCLLSRGYASKDDSSVNQAGAL
jgi:hypothetical protein